METRTNTALAGLTDAGLFERIATAVLRLQPNYEGLAHPGINAAGKTRKSPVDGLVFTGDDGNRLVMTDGSDALFFRDPTTFELIGQVQVTQLGTPVENLNELECVDGRVWANVWTTDVVLRIDPETGAVDGLLNASSLEQPRLEPTDVLNGIARNPADGALWVTGKLWPWLYRIELDPAMPAPLSPPDDPIQYNDDPEPEQCVPFQKPAERPNE